MVENPRHVDVVVEYQKAVSEGEAAVSPSPLPSKFIEGFTYVDPASGESDTISIIFDNSDFRWAGSWTPEIGDKLTARIELRNWGGVGRDGQAVDSIFDCGKFCLDDVSYTGPTLTCTVGGVSVPEANAYRSTTRTKTWKKATLKALAAEFAKRYHFTLQYIGYTIKIGTIQQNNETDSAFLKKVCESYGCGIKIYDGMIVVYDKVTMEDRPPVVEFSQGELQDWSFNTTLIGTYTGAQISYTNGKSSKTMKCKIGEGKRILTINEKVNSLADAKLKASAKVDAENEKAETMSATVMADSRIAAGCTVYVKGLSNLSGKYFVDKVIHNIGTDKAYTMSLEMHRCQARFAKEVKETIAAGDAVIVNGIVHTTRNGGKTKKCNGRKMYVTKVWGNKYKYPYSIARRKGGTRYGYCEKELLTKV